jgi:hypothetical protein
MNSERPRRTDLRAEALVDEKGPLPVLALVSRSCRPRLRLLRALAQPAGPFQRRAHAAEHAFDQRPPQRPTSPAASTVGGYALVVEAQHERRGGPKLHAQIERGRARGHTHLLPRKRTH